MTDLLNLLVTLGANVALFLSLAYIYDALTPWLQQASANNRALVLGLLFSMVAGFSFLLPVAIAPGILVGLYVVILAMAGAVAGWQAGAIAALILSLVQIFVGGAENIADIGAIVFAAALGIGVGRIWFQQQLRFNFRYLLILGLLLAAQHSLWLLLFPPADGLVVSRQLSIMLLYPLATLLLGVILARTNPRLRAEAYWQALVENAPDHILLIQTDGTILLSSETVAHNNFFRLIPPEQHGQLREKLQAATASRQVMHLDIPAVADSGDIWSYRISAIDHIADTYVVLGTDLTAYQETIDALIESESRYRNLVENSGVSISVYDAQGKLQFINAIGATYFHINPGAIVGQSLFDLFPEPFASNYLAHIQAVITTGQMVVAEDEVRLGGKLYWFASYIFPVHDSNGNISAAQIVSHDITERQQSLLDLEASETRFRSTFEAAPHGMAIADLNGHYTQVNDVLCQLLGYTPDEMITTPFADFTHPDDLANTDEYFQALIAGKIPVIHLEKRYRHNAGHFIWANLSVTLVRDKENNPLYAIAHIQDLTAIKAAEEARLMADRLRVDLETEKKLRELKSSLFSMFSHDIKNPMASIAMSVSMLEQYHEKMEPAVREQKFTSIYSQLERMESLLDDVLTLGRLDAGVVNFHPEYADLEAFCEKSFADMATGIGAAHQFVFKGTQHALFTHFDQHLMARALANVIGNAVKYSQAGSTVRFTIQQQDDQIVLDVTDEGIGIPPAEQQKLFEIFERGSNVGSIKGTGLGLAIVKQVIELHNGQVKVQSTVNEATTFTLILPFYADPPDLIIDQ